MENAEEVMQILERFTRLKQKEIPKELDDYLQYVAKTGDTVFKWDNLKYLFREKLLNVITHFHDTTPRMDEIPRYPNVDPFNYESMKSSLLERLEGFKAAPFTIQRLSELLIDPRKQYNRIDKFMRALEKNILVVSTVEPGRKRTESENGDSLDSVVNGDLSLDVNVDIDMENESLFSMETQNGNGTAEADGSPVGTVDGVNEAGDLKREEAETDPVVNVTSTHEAPTIDEDLQPSPKKVKLDVDAEVDAATEPTTEVDKKPTEVEKSDEISTEKLETKKETAEKVVEVEGKENKVTEKEENGKTEEKSPKEETKAEKKTAVKEPEDTSKLVDESDKKTKESEGEKIVKIVVKDKDVETPKETKENDVVDNALVEKENGKPEEELTSVAKQTDNKEAEEKIVEKQEIEKCEKDLAPTTEKVASEALVENGGETKPQPDEVEKRDADKVESEKQKEAIASKEPNDDLQSSKIKSEVVATTAELLKSEEVVDTTTAVKEKTETEKIAETIETETEKLITSSTAAEIKTEDPLKATPLAKTAEVKNDVATLETNVVDTTTTAITSTSSTEVSETKISVKPVDEDLPAVKTDSVEISAVKSISKDEAIVVATPPPSLPIPALPTLALNDQPMEEDTTNVVDEVVMAESTTTSGGVADGIEMATDAMEATVSSDTAKIDETADGMDVDDTSQPEEAMDQ